MKQTQKMSKTQKVFFFLMIVETHLSFCAELPLTFSTSQQEAEKNISSKTAEFIQNNINFLEEKNFDIVPLRAKKLIQEVEEFRLYAISDAEKQELNNLIGLIKWSTVDPLVLEATQYYLTQLDKRDFKILPTTAERCRNDLMKLKSNTIRTSDKMSVQRLIDFVNECVIK